MRLVAVSLLALTLFSCAKEVEKKKFPMKTRVGNIHFDNSVNEAEAGALVASLEHLAENRLLNADPRLLGILNVKSSDGPTVRTWLEERVQLIVGEGFKLNRFTAVEERYAFENPGVLPDAWKDRTNEEKEGTLVMANYGALAYLLGKEKSVLVGLDTSTSLGRLRFTSPRTGMLIIGEGLLKVVPGGNPLAERAFQLSTLLHEARHSDGNGKSLGFVHAKCPAGHSFAGVNACDEAANGPYIIDALAMKSMLDTCLACSASERAIMEGQVADSAGRVLNRDLVWDDRPEGRR